jgi:hypothetical protein
VRKDFREAAVVVRMNITDTKIIGPDTGIYPFIASGEVTMSFKGGFKVGQRLEFYTHAESGIDHADIRGDRIAFLASFVEGGKRSLKELPDGNSAHPYFPELLAKVRRVTREWQRRRRHHVY